MAENSKIEWTDHTFNPWMGCTKVHTGCANCYAETLMDKRWGKVEWGPSGTRVLASAATWKQPLKWNRDAEKAGKRAKVFCASLADIFENWTGQLIDAKGLTIHYDAKKRSFFTLGEIAIGRSVATMRDVRQELFSLIDATPNLDWLILTKRPENVRQMWPEVIPRPMVPAGRKAAYRRNVWLLTSVSNQETADKQIPELLKCRDLVPVLGLSCEPLVGPIDLEWPESIYGKDGPPMCCSGRDCGCHGMPIDPPMLFGIDWVIVGGESGNGARPCKTNWVDDIRDQCERTGVPCFVKQLGEHPIGSAAERMAMLGESLSGEDAIVRWKFRDKKGGDWSEWPEALRVREYPVCN